MALLVEAERELPPAVEGAALDVRLAISAGVRSFSGATLDEERAGMEMGAGEAAGAGVREGEVRGEAVPVLVTRRRLRDAALASLCSVWGLH